MLGLQTRKGDTMTDEQVNDDNDNDNNDDNNEGPAEAADILANEIVERFNMIGGKRAKIEAKIKELVGQLDELDEPSEQEVRDFCAEAITPIVDAMGDKATIELTWPIVAERFELPVKVRKARSNGKDASEAGDDGEGEPRKRSTKEDTEALTAKILDCLDYEGLTSKQVFKAVAEQVEGVERPNVLRILKKLVTDGKVAREGERASALFSLTS